MDIISQNQDSRQKDRRKERSHIKTRIDYGLITNFNTRNIQNMLRRQLLLGRQLKVIERKLFRRLFSRNLELCFRFSFEFIPISNLTIDLSKGDLQESKFTWNNYSIKLQRKDHSKNIWKEGAVLMCKYNAV